MAHGKIMQAAVEKTGKTPCDADIKEKSVKMVENNETNYTVVSNDTDQDMTIEGTTTNTSDQKMILYVYDHCLLSVAARCVFGAKNLPVEIRVLPNSDVDTPTKLIGKKALPILVKPDGSVMGESMDIVYWVDDHFGDDNVVDGPSGRSDIRGWIYSVGMTLRALLCPRWIRAPLGEFQDEASRVRFTKQKEALLGCTLAEALENTDTLLEQIKPDMDELCHILISEHGVNGEESIGADDIAIFSRLRALTLVKELVWPTKVRNYVDNMANIFNVPLYDDMATPWIPSGNKA